MEAGFKENRPQGTPLHPLKLYRMQTAAGRIDVPLHWQDTVELLWVQKGQLHLQIGDRQFAGQPGDVFYINPRQLHAMQTSGPEDRYLAFVFPLSWLRFALTDEAEQRYLQPLSADNARVENALPDGICPSAAALLADAATLYEKNSPGAWLGIKADILRLYFALYAGGLVSRNAAGEHRQDTRMAVSRYIQDHCAEPLSLQTLGRQFHMSPKYFSSWFQKHFFRTFTDYLTAVRLEQAKKLLLDTDADIELIAQRSGFSSGNYFIRTFRRATGMTPGRYRRTLPGRRQ